MRKALLIASVAGSAMTGCTVYDGQFAWTEGWKRVRIVEVLPKERIARPGSPDCRASPEAGAIALFAVVDVPLPNRVRRATIPLPDGFRYDPSKTYIANLWTCSPTLRESSEKSPSGDPAGAVR
jgi:hypothetical protein